MFPKNRDRLLEGDIAAKFLGGIGMTLMVRLRIWSQALPQGAKARRRGCASLDTA